jgi:antitoxin (DNA-binding transcriptional repressor) of toxin-antitoxin stability system
VRSLNVHEAKTHLSAVLAEIEEREESFLICRHGRPIADLIPHRKKNRLAPHPLMRKIKIGYDATEPLSATEWPEEP